MAARHLLDGAFRRSQASNAPGEASVQSLRAGGKRRSSGPSPASAGRGACRSAGFGLLSLAAETRVRRSTTRRRHPPPQVRGRWRRGWRCSASRPMNAFYRPKRFHSNRSSTIAITRSDQPRREAIAASAPRPRRRRSMLRSVGDDLQAHLLAVLLAQHRAQIADAVGEAELDRPGARPEGAGEEVGIVGEPAAAPLLDQVDEGGVDVVLERLQAGDVLLAARAGTDRASPCSRRRCGRAARRRCFSIRPVKPKPAETTPMEPTIELSSTTISSPAAAIM